MRYGYLLFQSTLKDYKIPYNCFEYKTLHYNFYINEDLSGLLLSVLDKSKENIQEMESKFGTHKDFLNLNGIDDLNAFLSQTFKSSIKSY